MIEAVAASMFRVFLFVLALGVAAVFAGAVYIGWRPPSPPLHHVEKTLPTDKFQSH
jgi:hypothetical protein